MQNNKIVLSTLVIILVIIITGLGYVFINKQVKENIGKQEKSVQTKKLSKFKPNLKSQLPKPSIEQRSINLKSEPIKKSLAVMAINSDQANYQTGQSFKLKITIDGNGEIVDGAEFNLFYDPAIIKIDKIVPGLFFSLYPRKIIDETKGQIKVIALQKPEENKKCFKELIATLNATVLKQGKTNLNFDKQKTNAAGYGGQNLLKEAKGLSITIAE